jgi:hypothetical protein
VRNALSAVSYVGLRYGDTDVPWDFGDWHRPEVARQLVSSTGDAFHATWDDEVTSFELRLSERPFVPRNPELTRPLVVSDHPRWKPLLGLPLVQCDLVLGLSDDPRPSPVPLAVRLATERNVVWIAAAAPRDDSHARADLGGDDVWIGFDEVIAVFDDGRAHQIGLCLPQ